MLIINFSAHQLTKTDRAAVKKKLDLFKGDRLKWHSQPVGNSAGIYEAFTDAMAAIEDKYEHYFADEGEIAIIPPEDARLAAAITLAMAQDYGMVTTVVTSNTPDKFSKGLVVFE
jgi:hypothetical protein